MEKAQMLDVMGQFKLYKIEPAYDEIIATAVKRQHEPQRTLGDLLIAEISKGEARSLINPMTLAKLPFAKEIDEANFEETPGTEMLVRNMTGGDFLEHLSNVVLTRGPPTGKSQPLVGIARA